MSDVRAHRSHLEAAQATVGALRADGDLPDDADGLVQAYLSISALLDVSPIPPAAIVREHRLLHKAVTEAGRGRERPAQEHVDALVFMRTAAMAERLCAACRREWDATPRWLGGGASDQNPTIDRNW